MGLSDFLDNITSESDNFDDWDKRPDSYDPTDPAIGLSGFIDQITRENNTPKVVEPKRLSHS